MKRNISIELTKRERTLLAGMLNERLSYYQNPNLVGNKRYINFCIKRLRSIQDKIGWVRTNPGGYFKY